jgi:hypothetical protein
MLPVIRTITVYLILSFENGQWIRVGRVWRQLNAARSWIPFVRKARYSKRCKVQPVDLQIDANDDWTAESVKLMSEAYNVDLT